jgi:hypothetical protein
MPILDEDILVFAAGSAACSASTIITGIAVAVVQQRRPDLRWILALATLAPLSIPILGGYAMALTLIPILPLSAVVALVTGWDLLPLLSRYIAFGICAYGLAIQVRWLWEASRP